MSFDIDEDLKNIDFDISSKQDLGLSDYNEERNELIDIDGTLKSNVSNVDEDVFDTTKISSHDILFNTLDNAKQEEILYKEKIQFLYENFGKVLVNFLEDKSIIEIRLNQDGSLWIEKYGVGSIRTEFTMSTIEGNRILQLVADFNKTTIKNESPRISAILPNGERFEGLSYIATGYKPVFVIRKKSENIITLQEYLEKGTITKENKDYLEKVMNGHKNILVVGGTSTGKTTFCNALLDVIKDTTDRVIVLEDTKELVCKVNDKVELVSSDYCSMKDLLVSCMRLTPTRIVLGELRRGQEALDLLKAWNSGHSGGVCTIHSNDALSGLYKLEQYLDEVAEKPQSLLISQSIDVVVSLVKTKDFRRVLYEIIEVQKYDLTKKEYVYNTIYKNETVDL